jgi:hypothetical protein
MYCNSVCCIVYELTRAVRCHRPVQVICLYVLYCKFVYGMSCTFVYYLPGSARNPATAICLSCTVSMCVSVVSVSV